jgi:hypothetical protein
MARILDFYDVRWEYEPTTFPILWNLDGDVVESFARTSTCPTSRCYLEMTTLKQRLVRKKTASCAGSGALPGHPHQAVLCPRFRRDDAEVRRLGLAESLSGTTWPGRPGPRRRAAAVAIDLARPSSRPRARRAHHHLPAADAPGQPADATMSRSSIAADPAAGRRRRAMANQAGLNGDARVTTATGPADGTSARSC